MSDSAAKSLTTTTRLLLLAGIAVQVFIIASYVLGPAGLSSLSLPTFGGRLIGDGSFAMHAEGVLSRIPAVDADLAWANGPEGSTDISTGLPAVELSGPYTATINLLNPGSAERLAYVTSRILGPLVAIVALFLLYRVVSSVSSGSPFTAQNGKRLWWLALLIGLGGMAAAVATSLADRFLISRSAAASVFRTDYLSIPFWPVILGLIIAVVALAWSRGTALEEDQEGLI